MLIVGIVDFGNSSWISELTPAVEMQVCPLFSGKYLGEIQYNTIQYGDKEEFQITTKSLEESFDGEGCKGRHT